MKRGRGLWYRTTSSGVLAAIFIAVALMNKINKASPDILPLQALFESRPLPSRSSRPRFQTARAPEPPRAFGAITVF